MFTRNALMPGKVEHRRVAQVEHRLDYRVLSLLVNLDRLEQLESNLRLFSVNRPNLFSLNYKDLGDGDETDLAGFARGLVKQKFPDLIVKEVWLQTYPRVLGYVFNPLSVYFCLDEKKQLRAAIFEVSNTFGEHTHYVQKVVEGKVEPARKSMLVSPFNTTSGSYGFTIHRYSDELTIGVSLRERKLPILKTWFRAREVEFTDMGLLKQFLRLPLMTHKVIVSIHYEALKLWLKGLRTPGSSKAAAASMPEHSNR